MRVLTIFSLALLTRLCWRAWVLGSAGRWTSRVVEVGEAAVMRPGWGRPRSAERSCLEATRLISVEGGRLRELQARVSVSRCIAR